eukprot:CAMPEP_0184975852 /NCGR_PEP_ID=MMETSP1098-20130426/6947_1 /TAXON_ID=89044 /ORGANISM="Spumella elongata, Strain CCAP 955/1" /LENGTH=855 /DNA_ID=CAMNT_0027498627 /DNA_START=54 /DNA_END=2621 /DNA_ORIENTATION=+
MFNFGALAANVLNSLDNAAKDTLEEPRVSATALRSQQRRGQAREEDVSDNEEDNEVDYSPTEEEDGGDEPGYTRPPLGSAVTRTRSTSSTGSVPASSAAQEAPPSPPKSSPRGSKSGSTFGVGYALSYESASNSSTVSIDNEEVLPQTPVGAQRNNNESNNNEKPVALPVNTGLGIAAESPFPAENAVESEAAGTVDTQATATESTASAVPAPVPAPAPAPAPSTPKSKAPLVESVEPTHNVAPVAADSPKGIIGNLVSLSSSSAKKLLSTPLAMSLSSGNAGVSSASLGDTEAEAAQTQGVAGSGAGVAAAPVVKDTSKDKEVALLKKTLKKKNQEIEKLNREVLDLEEHSVSLKQEVQEAWDNYKTAQEKAAQQESELHDEIRQIQKAKLSDKQQAVAQISKMNEEVAEAVRQVQAAQQQTRDLQAKLDAATEEGSHYETRISTLQQQLKEAQTGTVQGVAALHEEIRQMVLNTEQMRIDHSSLIKQNQLRQADLERENAELVASLTAQQKEIVRLQHNSGNNVGALSNIDNNIDYITLQQELSTLSSKYEEMCDKNEENERKVKLMERENRAFMMNNDDEKRRNLATIDELTLKVSELESKLNNKRLGGGNSGTTGAGAGNGNLLFSSASVDAGDGGSPQKDDTSHPSHGMDYDTMYRELQEHRAQSQNLSKLLLKKQGAVLELQAERSALKSRLVDLQTRCSEAERQLAQSRDLEGGLGFGGDDEEGDGYEDGGAGGSSAGTSGMLVRRGGPSALSNSSSSKHNRLNSRDTKVISDLERFGVKPGASVTRAVNMIDTWTIITGRFLRVYPLARLGFVFYLLLLHLWVLFILVMQTHSLELDTEPLDQLMHA